MEHLCRPNRGTIKCSQHIVEKSLTPLTIVLAALFLLCAPLVIRVVKTTRLSSPIASEGPTTLRSVGAGCRLTVSTSSAGRYAERFASSGLSPDPSPHLGAGDRRCAYGPVAECPPTWTPLVGRGRRPAAGSIWVSSIGTGLKVSRILSPIQ